MQSTSSSLPADQLPAPTSPIICEALCVDLDGTLIAGDMLAETVVHLVRRRPIDLLLLPLWLARSGRPGLKRQAAQRCQIDPASLPYRAQVLEFLRSERAAGRRIILATASDRIVATAIAEHLGLFDGVLSSDGATNLKGTAKLAAIQALCPEGFDYVGDSRADMPLFKEARRVYLVCPSGKLLREAQSVCAPARVFSGNGHQMAALLRLVRPHQWPKNALLFLPVLLAHDWHDWAKLRAVLLATVCFCLCASGVYVCNDLLDVQDDRHHREKSQRPFASGALPLFFGPVILLALLGVAFLLATLLLPRAFVLTLGAYFCMSSAYSFYFKRKLLVDVMLLAGLYTMRLLAGGAACTVEVSPWMLAFSIFLFVSLAFAKRYAELRGFLTTSQTTSDVNGVDATPEGLTLRGRGYRLEDLQIIRVVGPCSGYMAVLVFALYIYSNETIFQLYKHPLMLWLLCPLMMYWITRIWFIANRGALNEDPVLFAVTDRVSWYVAITAAALLCMATV